LERSQYLRPVLWFAEVAETPHIIAVGAGADLFGSHSIALDSKGKVYTWGIGSACGRGSRKPSPEPAVVEELGEVEITQVECGGGYCAALSKHGELYTWGNWSGGRLGLGPVPSKSDPSYLHGRGRKRLLPLLLYPKKVPLDGVKLQSVSCGDSHTAAITRDGCLLMWGQNESGQLGVGPSLVSGILEPSFTPSPVPYFDGRDIAHRVVFVACGASHTLVIDGEGEVWTWGALGGACLGHGSGENLNGKPRHTFRPTSELQAARAVRQRSGRSTAEVSNWSVPRRCVALSGSGAVRASLGERHTVVLLKCGRVMMCGDGVALSHHLAAKEGQSMKQVMSRLDAAEPVSVMRMPCASWFPSLEGKHISSVHCGGQHTIIMSRGEHIGMTLGWSLLQAARRSSSKRRTNTKEAGSGDDDDSERAWNELDVLSEGCDCVIITSGSVLPAHRVILAKRSRVLQEIIAEEEIPGSGGVLELLLPELRHDTALALREYLYTDTVSYPLEPGYSLPMDLMIAAEAYDLPRLKALCMAAIPESVSKVSSRLPIPQSQLASDFGSALGDSNWSDVKFIAEGKAIHAHMSVLSASSEYFAKMFSFGLDDGQRESLEVVVPDAYVGMLRMLLWIYTGYIDSSDESIVLEDLMAADRFQLLEMKRSIFLLFLIS
jgi:alpha-tubulin suppressor-like RCC1 family protein